MKTNYTMEVIQMEHGEESAITSQGIIEWKNGKLKVRYETYGRYRWPINQIQQQMYDFRGTLLEWSYFQYLKVLTFKIPHIILTWEKGRFYK